MSRLSLFALLLALVVGICFLELVVLPDLVGLAKQNEFVAPLIALVAMFTLAAFLLRRLES